jgi:cellulose synthase/poly-beta-1,6-N-acetylglucosamine synthase-like glycosyltransferase
MTWPTFIYLSTAALFVAFAVAALWQLQWVRRLPNIATTSKVSCSVIIAARDEEARIENTVRRLLAQTGIDLELVVVDDRSQDQTPKILERLAREDSRVQIKRVDVLPEGWLGKCHACHIGAQAATREWILFTDADCWLKPDAISRAIAVAEREAADHITLAPGTGAPSVWTRAWHLLFLVSLLGWISGVNRDRPKAHIGIGAFNLVRASVYKAFGGYEALRLTVLDDVKFGRLVRRVGKRTRAYLGMDDVECHWGTSVRGMIKIMEKNYFAAVDFRLPIVIAGVVFVAVMCGIVVAGLLSRTPAGFVAAFSPLLICIPAAALAKRLGWPVTAALGTPLMIPVFWYALINSTFITLRQGGVRWRDTFYPLKALRAGMVR